MKRPLSLKAYQALSRRGPRPPSVDPATRAPRPKDRRVFWVHAPDTSRRAAALHLAGRIALQSGEPAHVLLTTLEDTPPQLHKRPYITWEPCPAEHPETVAEFIDHWMPDLCLWSTGELRPLLIARADEAGVPMILVDAAEGALSDRSLRPLLDLTRSTLDRFSAIYAGSANAARRLRRLGVADDDIHLSGPLQDGAIPLRVNEAELEEMSDVFGSRPVWLAARLAADEVCEVLEAHQRALRTAHRLLLILVPEDPEAPEPFIDALQDSGLAYVQWSTGGWPDEQTEVILADTRGEMGLWYRLAPITFVGGSLASGTGGHDPYEAATLGSAIIYGPHVRRHLAAYNRLAAAGAARVVKDASGLAAAVTWLIAPDVSASMAHSAWECLSEGAEVTDQVVDLALDLLDHAGGG
ncbi:3-deoxy-D-manno-octulosonic acid transferase [Mesobacterium pallidum]|uniref:3-deoxy-D-manno-octulosonic acid transferase n=1 Tax=Mesobacterium pallidum TaxID=2872037 RepID=UPI001EE190F9|nr:glycosyltransferase N-terminal domain-containing protein [Mesobacterium pallidum]